MKACFLNFEFPSASELAKKIIALLCDGANNQRKK